MHFFTVENERFRSGWALEPVWKRFNRLSNGSVFEAFDTLASMSTSAHLIQIFGSTMVRAHVWNDID